MPSILVDEVEDGVWQITLNRPEKRNALDASQWEALTETVRTIETEETVGCLVLTGAGSAFASGGDVAAFRRELRASDGPRLFRARIQSCLETLYDFPAPTIAMVNGPAIGGGMELALACDVRVASDSAHFAMPATRLGIVVAFPEFRRLATAVGADRARYLAMTGIPVGADDAVQVGLAHQVVPAGQLVEETLQVAQRLLAGDRQSQLWFRRAARFVETGAVLPDDFRTFEETCLTGVEFRRRVEAHLKRKKT